MHDPETLTSLSLNRKFGVEMTVTSLAEGYISTPPQGARRERKCSPLLGIDGEIEVAPAPVV